MAYIDRENKTRGYAYRKHQQKRHIKKKLFVLKNVYQLDDAYIPCAQPHRLDKRKIHCSCPMCSEKTKNAGWKHADLVNMQKGRE